MAQGVYSLGVQAMTMETPTPRPAVVYYRGDEPLSKVEHAALWATEFRCRTGRWPTADEMADGIAEPPRNGGYGQYICRRVCSAALVSAKVHSL